MPTYSFFCDGCQEKFELYLSIQQYDTAQKKCPVCKKDKKVSRLYQEDLSTLNTAVKKSDNELKTIGDIANRNRDRMSDDQKQYLSQKHNDYKEQVSTKELPKGMSRIQKPKHKIKWRNDG